jgi:quercetin dioxygenase-like cupin family protein
MKRRNFLASGLLAGITATNSYVLASTHELIGNNKKPLNPFYIPPSPESLKAGPTGGDFRVKVRSTQTNLQYSCMEGLIEPKIMGPAPHVHKELDEGMFVQEGTISVLVGEKVYELEAGGWHMRPHGIVHTYWNATDKTAMFIDMFFNQDFEKDQ